MLPIEEKIATEIAKFRNWSVTIFVKVFLKK
jgi:hypothetical protein